MTLSQRLLVGFYALLALGALVGTFSQNMQLHGDGPMGPFAAFLQGAKANAAGRSLAIDISFFLEAAAVFMVIEARRLGVRWVWLYLRGGFLIAISVTFPLFMIARELRLAPAVKPDTPWSLTVLDLIGPILVSATVGAVIWYMLT